MLEHHGANRIASSGQQDKSCPQPHLLVSAYIEAQQNNQTHHTNQQPDQTKATDPLALIEDRREQRNQ